MIVKCPQCKSKLVVGSKADHARCEVCDHVFYVEKEESTNEND